ncbi:MAG: MFS transporter [Novosphingobium sp.]|nr:MFS transporter [Novosphingobium sp.]
MTEARPWRPFGLLLLFLLLHVLNQVDRSLIASFGPEIVAELDLTRTQFSIVSGLAFTVPYALTALTAGVLADKYGRTRIMAAGLATWSAFTALSGLARSFLTLAPVPATPMLPMAWFGMTCSPPLKRTSSGPRSPTTASPRGALLVPVAKPGMAAMVLMMLFRPRMPPPLDLLDPPPKSASAIGRTIACCTAILIRSAMIWLATPLNTSPSDLVPMIASVIPSLSALRPRTSMLSIASLMLSADSLRSSA